MATSETTSVRDIVRGMILAHEPRLSTGAYGDEGQILLELDQVAYEAWSRLDGNTSQMGLVTAWLGDRAVSPEGFEAQTWGLMLSGLLRRWTPLRASFGSAQRDAIKTMVRMALEAQSPEDPDSLEWLRSRLAEAIDTFGMLEIGRGDVVWQVLHRADLLAPLAPFIREFVHDHAHVEAR